MHKLSELREKAEEISSVDTLKYINIVMANIHTLPKTINFPSALTTSLNKYFDDKNIPFFVIREGYASYCNSYITLYEYERGR